MANVAVQNLFLPLQLELWTGHRGVHPQGMLSTQALSPTLRYCEGGMEEMDEMECLVLVDLKDRGESKEWQVLLAQGMVGWSIQGGGKIAVQMSLELSWCMQKGLEEAGTATLEEVPTTSACPMIQTTLHTNLECKGGAVYGAEYEPWAREPFQALHNHNVPCAVCYASTRVAVTMIPAKTCCPSTWTLEYSGYLMSTAEQNSHYHTMFECVDKSPDSVPGSASNHDGAVFYHTEAACTGMPCPPEGRNSHVQFVPNKTEQFAKLCTALYKPSFIIAGLYICADR